MDLVIVESPSKAKTISKYLGGGYRVVASGGHIRDLAEKKLAVNVHNNFEPEYQINATKTRTVQSLKKEVANSAKIYLATDPDREGEAISWHLKEVLGLKEENRIVFNEITKKAVNNAISASRNIDMNLVDSQQARRVLDRLVGYLISPIVSRKIQSGLSAGRVQSVALRMIADKEAEIRAFVPEEYWNIFAELKSLDSGKTFKAQFGDINGKKAKIGDKESALEVVENSKLGKWLVDSVKRAKSFSKPNPPFTTSTMQQDAVNKLGLSASDIMRLAQQLYEGVEMSDGEHQALVTYIRTDSVRISDEAQAMARQFILGNYGDAFCPPRYNKYDTKANAQDAHEAIRPVSLDIAPDSLKGKIDNKLYRLYKLIYERFLASQMTNAEYDTLNVHIISRADKDYGYTLKGKTMTFAGFKQVYTSSMDEEEKDTALPQINENELLELLKMVSEQKFTKPPLRFTDSSLVKAMEENGIGRPSTYASILSILSKRAYTEKESKYIKPTQLGELLSSQLVKYFPNIMDTQFTADMETKLDTVADGHVDWHKIITDFYPDFIKSLEQANDGERVRLDPIETPFVCEKCGKPLQVKSSRYGKFLGCSGYPECNYMRSYEEYEGAMKSGVLQPLPKCSKCGKDMSLKGKFYGCSGYPECKNTMNIANNGAVKELKVSNMPAPVCEKCGATMALKSKGASQFYACPNFPKCRNIKPFEEVEGKCPKCGSDIIKSYGRGGKVKYRCANEKCGYKPSGEAEDKLCPKCNSTMKPIDIDGKTVMECQNPACNHIEDGNAKS